VGNYMLQALAAHVRNFLNEAVLVVPRFYARKNILLESRLLASPARLAHTFIHRKCAELYLPQCGQHVTLRN